MKSKIKWLEDEKSNCYIKYRGNDVFVYLSATKGKTIELKLSKTKKGYTLVSLNEKDWN